MPYSYEKFLNELGAKLRQMRVDRGWTLRDMIVKHGFHLTQWQKFEKGTAVSVPSLLRLCEVFDVSLETLIADLGRVPEEAEKSLGKIRTKKNSGTKASKPPPSQPLRSPRDKPEQL